jgi:peptidoglycan LD-endopeptidase CwlK
MQDESADLQRLQPRVARLARKLVSECEAKGLPIFVTRGMRSIEDQDAFFAKGRTEPGEIITMAKGGYSYHNYGVAFDVRPVTFIDEKDKLAQLQRAGEIGEALGLEWGGRWKEFLDPPHFQYTAGYSIDDFRTNAVDWSQFQEILFEFREVDRARFEEVRSGIKRIETRAAQPKYQDIREGDEITFVCGGDQCAKRVTRVFRWKNIDEMLREVELKYVMPDLDTIQQVKERYASYPKYDRLIEEFGIVGFELE